MREKEADFAEIGKNGIKDSLWSFSTRRKILVMCQPTFWGLGQYFASVCMYF